MSSASSVTAPSAQDVNNEEIEASLKNFSKIVQQYYNKIIF